VIAAAADRLAADLPVFTGAYIINNGGVAMPKQEFVVRRVLLPFHAAAPRLAAAAMSTKSWRTVAGMMSRLEGFGGKGFMTKETLLDAMLTPVLADCRDRNTWCPCGPGTRRGLNRIHSRPEKFSREGWPWLDEMLAILRAAPPYLGAHMPPIDLTDIQWNLCEFSKYERVRLGEGTPRSRYKP
jgi:hypothetical protein